MGQTQPGRRERLLPRGAVAPEGWPGNGTGIGMGLVANGGGPD
ncbi:MAG: hypothetical protein U0R78_02450 [Nocardioidaceae bacterium]